MLELRQADSDYSREETPKSKALFAVLKESGVDFVHKELEYDDYKKEVLLPHKTSQFGPALAIGDVNGDGEDDFYIGGAAGQSGALYLQNNGSFTRSLGQVWDKKGSWKEDKGYEDVAALFFEAHLELLPVPPWVDRPGNPDGRSGPSARIV